MKKLLFLVLMLLSISSYADNRKYVFHNESVDDWAIAFETDGDASADSQQTIIKAHSYKAVNVRFGNPLDDKKIVFKFKFVSVGKYPVPVDAPIVKGTVTKEGYCAPGEGQAYMLESYTFCNKAYIESDAEEDGNVINIYYG